MPSSEAPEEIELTCPLCEETHRYPLIVEWAAAVALRGRRGRNLPQRTRSFRRVFTCPTRAQHFEATLELTDDPATYIKDVRIGS
jgi:hypothetical protein